MVYRSVFFLEFLYILFYYIKKVKLTIFPYFFRDITKNLFKNLDFLFSNRFIKVKITRILKFTLYIYSCRISSIVFGFILIYKYIYI